VNIGRAPKVLSTCVGEVTKNENMVGNQTQGDAGAYNPKAKSKNREQRY
jgi:hypothetical protein